MDKILNKAAEILVESGYADDINDDHVAFAHQVEEGNGNVGIDFEFRPVQPFADTLEGRRQADAIEDWLLDKHIKLFTVKACMACSSNKNNHQWRLDRIKWCLEQLTKA